MQGTTEVFLIDSNALMTPYKNYYPFDIAPCFWDQIGENVESGRIAVLDVVKAEVEKGDDNLSKWIKDLSIAQYIDHRQKSILAHYSEILTYIQTCGFYTAHALREWANAGEADPWLIAAAIETGYTIVTFESSAGVLSMKNPSRYCKIPDVSDAFKVKYDNLFTMMRKLSISLH
ncbi:MAG TPA: DUF4411 family protein [Eubacteriales bacterium]|nr:DUF4411 family protein [Eubacteriales bacterium]